MQKLSSEISIIILLFIWAGAIIGLSFIATPIKFKADGLTIPVAVEIGKVTFHLFNKVEWFTFIACSILAYNSKITKYPIILLLIIFVILLIQTFLLFPILDNNIILLKESKYTNPIYIIYIVTELIKLLGLIILGTYLLLILPSNTKLGIK
ncbi:MAG: hypothetical protein RCG15_06535 [Candidatus Rickettsia vulgarisii]